MVEIKSSPDFRTTIYPKGRIGMAWRYGNNRVDVNEYEGEPDGYGRRGRVKVGKPFGGDEVLPNSPTPLRSNYATALDVR